MIAHGFQDRAGGRPCARRARDGETRAHACRWHGDGNHPAPDHSSRPASIGGVRVMNRGYGISGVALAAAACILFARAAHAELAFAGAGAQQCNVVNSNAVPGRGSGQNTVILMIFSWIQGYMSGFHGFQLLTQDSTSFDLGAVSPAAQWEFIVSYCRSHPHEQIVRGIQELQLKLLKK
jgi:hypothetical protein